MIRMLPAFLASLLLAGTPAAADSDSSSDRAELEMAAGRIVFQSTSLYGAIANPGMGSPSAPDPAPVAADPPRADPSRTALRGAAAAGRRPVRVVYPGPYSR